MSDEKRCRICGCVQPASILSCRQCGAPLVKEPIINDSTNIVCDINPDNATSSSDSIDQSDGVIKDVNQHAPQKQLILQVKPGCLIKVNNGDIIGRAAVGSNFLSEFPKVSRYHAKISYQNGQWFLEDNNSSNGTFFEEKRVRTLVLNLGLSFFLSRTCKLIVVSC
jgi:hypothetical protein